MKDFEGAAHFDEHVRNNVHASPLFSKRKEKVDEIKSRFERYYAYLFGVTSRSELPKPHVELFDLVLSEAYKHRYWPNVAGYTVALLEYISSKLEISIEDIHKFLVSNTDYLDMLLSRALINKYLLDELISKLDCSDKGSCLKMLIRKIYERVGSANTYPHRYDLQLIPILDIIVPNLSGDVTVLDLGSGFYKGYSAIFDLFKGTLRNELSRYGINISKVVATDINESILNNISEFARKENLDSKVDIFRLDLVDSKNLRKVLDKYKPHLVIFSNVSYYLSRSSAFDVIKTVLASDVNVLAIFEGDIYCVFLNQGHIVVHLGVFGVKPQMRPLLEWKEIISKLISTGYDVRYGSPVFYD